LLVANPWFRMYAEFANDQKVQMLCESDQRRLVMLFCLRCNDNVTLHDEEVTFLLRISNDEWQKSKVTFLERGFIDKHNQILNWDKRQFKSDTSKNRVSAYRERNKNKSNGNVTLHSNKSNAVDTDTDTEHKNLKTIVRSATARFQEFWEVWPKSPRKVDKLKCEKKWKDKKLDLIADQIIQHVVEIKKTKQWLDGFEPAPMTYINGGRWADEIFTDADKPSTTKPWFISNTAIEAKGKELNIQKLKDEQFPNYKLRVYQAAGITHEMVQTAKQDFEGKK
jgi:hypothetical protein